MADIADLMPLLERATGCNLRPEAIALCVANNQSCECSPLILAIAERIVRLLAEKEAAEADAERRAAALTAANEDTQWVIDRLAAAHSARLAQTGDDR